MEPAKSSPLTNDPETPSTDNLSPVTTNTDVFASDPVPATPLSGIITPDPKPATTPDVSPMAEPTNIGQSTSLSGNGQVTDTDQVHPVFNSVPSPTTVEASRSDTVAAPQDNKEVVTSAGPTVAPTTAPQPVAVGTPTVGASEPLASADGKKPHAKKRWLLPVIVGVVTLLVLSAAYVFGLYLPNRPTAVYDKSMTRTADASDVLVKYAQAQAAVKYTGASITGAFNGKLSNLAFDGTLKGQTDGSNSTVLITTDIAGQKLSLETRTIKVPQSGFPDLYAKVSGLDGVSSLIGTPLASKLNNQWIMFDHTLLDTLQSSNTGTTNTSSVTPTLSQIDDAVAKVQAVNRDYLFSANPDKAIFTYGNFVGTEVKDGQKVNHYKVLYNKSHLKAYISAVGSALDTSSLNDWAKKQYDGKSISQTAELSAVQKSIDNSKSAMTFDMYVNLKTKLVQSFSSTQKRDSGTGTDAITISQFYTGSGTTYPFQIDLSTTGSEASDMQGTLKLSVDTKANTIHFGGDYKSLAKNDDARFSMTVDAKPTTAPLTVSSPTGAKSYNDIVTELMGGSGVLGAETNTPNAAIFQGLQQRL